MAGNPPDGLGDAFLEQILAGQSVYTSSEAAAAAAGYGGGEVGSMAPMDLQLGSSDGLSGMGLGMGMAPPLGLNQQQGFLRQERFREEVVDAPAPPPPQTMISWDVEHEVTSSSDRDIKQVKRPRIITMEYPDQV
ncbi:hypothetical protein FH972_003954 [Carpinus fangiana]|uniref:Uncharacterized protein n=1 Tax=Carpinus fangiana TaxID=176857 RepID=A0A5N6QK87_9ROSI|nr:hypothetical protein FH972_003954 [Carpinus fangiana]